MNDTRYCTATTHDWVRLTPDFQYCRECGETVVAQDAATATLRAVSQAAREALSCDCRGSYTNGASHTDRCLTKQWIARHP